MEFGAYHFPSEASQYPGPAHTSLTSASTSWGVARGTAGGNRPRSATPGVVSLEFIGHQADLLKERHLRYRQRQGQSGSQWRNQLPRGVEYRPPDFGPPIGGLV